jgi:lipid II:glycine glycyltransferase (peptidoglycan interpeptide bridge formation enzyme)
MEIQQSPLYAEYIKNLKWVVENINGSYIFIKPFLFIGGLMKIQRTKKLPDIKKLVPIIKKYRIRTIAIEPDASVTSLCAWLMTIPKYIKINKDYFLPTKTIRIDLQPTESEIFQSFSEAKRRAVRRAQKNNIQIIISDNIDTFIKLKNKTAGSFGFITTYGIDKLWNIFPNENKQILLATTNDNPVGGILLLYWDSIAYYWIAGATHEGKKLFAPTILVWEALKKAKKHNAKVLDFVGVWDERLPTKNLSWKGFTKFKEGFGGNELYYPLISH